MVTSASIRRGFASVGDRRVHYLRAGSGSPVLLVHPSPADATLLKPLIDRLARKYTAFAFDSPGFGASDPLQQETILIADIADALAETLRAMSFPKLPVFGTHTGAGIALELGVRHPDLVSGLILDGVPIFTREEVEARIRDGYFYLLEPHALGGHFTNTWTRFRDQMTYHPWCTKTPENANVSGVFATPASTDHWVTMFYRAAPHFEKPYKAAHYFGEVAAERLVELQIPAVFTASSTDGLSKHFNRFPTLRPNQALIPLGPGREDKYALIEDYVARYATEAAAPADSAPAGDSNGIAKLFVDLPHGQVFVRAAGQAATPPLVLLHDAPGSSHALEPLISALSLTYRVFALDLPGCGESGPLAGERPTLADFALTVRAVCERLALHTTLVYGIGFGASVAIEVALCAPGLVERLVLRGVLIPPDDVRREMQANYGPPIGLDASGAHWYRTWLMLRDSLVYWPWYKRTKDAVRRVPADFGAQRLHDWTSEVMKQRDAYHHVIDAALHHDAAAVVQGLPMPVLLCLDPLHPCSCYYDKLTSLLPAAETCNPTSNVIDHAQQIQMFVTTAR